MEIFNIETDLKDTNIQITSYGTIQAENDATIVAQASGQITDKNIEEGQKIDTTTTTMTIGNSPQSDINQINYANALYNEQIARQNQNLTEIAASQNLDSAELAIKSSLRTYQSSQNTRENTIDLFKNQWENSQIEIDNAEINLDSAEESYDNMLDQIDDLEDDLFDIDDDIYYNDDPTVRQQLIAQEDALESQIDALENQLDLLKYNIEIAENRVEQSKIAKYQLEDNYRNQFNQINTSIDQSYTQYLQSLNQLEAAQTSYYLQNNSAKSQTANSQTNREISAVNLKYNAVKSSIPGTITDILVKEGDFVNPGTPLFTVSNSDTLKITTNINKSQKKFVKINQSAIIKGNNQSFLGKITNISPTVDSITQKIEVEISIFNAKDLQIGDYLEIEIPITSKDTIFVPLESLYLNEDKTEIRTVKNGKITYKTVQTGEIIGEFIEIKSGLTTKDQVVKSSELTLEENETVTINQS